MKASGSGRPETDPGSCDRRSAPSSRTGLISGLLAAIVLVTLVLSGMSAGPASASSGFRKFQIEEMVRSAGLIGAANAQLGAVLDIYIDHPTGDIYWNDPAIAGRFNRFSDLLEEQDRLMVGVRSAASAAYGNHLRRIRKTGRPARTTRCPAWHGSRSALRKGKADYTRFTRSFSRVERSRTALGARMAVVEALIEGRVPVTDGHLDGAVYDFGTDDILYAPEGAPPVLFDPVDLAAFSDLFWEYGGEVDPVFLNGFIKRLETSLKQAGKASRVCGVS